MLESPHHKSLIIILSEDKSLADFYSKPLRDLFYNVINVTSYEQLIDGNINGDILAVIILDSAQESKKNVALDISRLTSSFKAKFYEAKIILVSPNLTEKEDSIDFLKLIDAHFIAPFDISLLVEYLHKNSPSYNQKESLESFLYKTSSERMLKTYKVLNNIAKSDYSALFYGESGVGKKMIALYVHKNSKRQEAPFIVFNTVIYSHANIESEFIKSALNADLGSLLIIAPELLDIKMQEIITDLINTKEIYSNEDKKRYSCNVRILCSSHNSFSSEDVMDTSDNRFFNLIKVFSVEIPPLRDRLEDVSILTEHFLSMNSSNKTVKMELSALKKLSKYNFPGNITELKYIIDYALLLSSGNMVKLEDIQTNIKWRHKISNRRKSLHDELKETASSLVEAAIVSGQQQVFSDYASIVEKPLLDITLEKTEGNKSKAAKLLGINRNTLRTKLQKYNLD